MDGGSNPPSSTICRLKTAKDDFLAVFFTGKSIVTKLQAHPGMGRAGRVPGTRELVLHKNYIAIYRVRGDDVEILRLHHADRNL